MKYFLHDSNALSDEKLTELYMNFGYEGIGLFYTALEKLAFQEKPIKTIVLKKQLNIGKRLEKCWKFMEEIGIISSKNGESFNENILNYSESYQIKKEKTRKKISEWREKQQDKKNVTSYETVSNPPKVKLSKVKLSKDIIKDVTHAKMRDVFKEFYFKNKKIEYLWDAKNAGALAQIISKIKKIAGEDPDSILQSWQVILEKNQDKWINDNLSVPLINSKFNEIVAKIKGHDSSDLKSYTQQLMKEMTNEQTGNY
jgi:hypothetical protein